MRRVYDIARTFAVKDFRIARSYRLSFVLGIGATFYALLSFRFISKVVGPGGALGSPDAYFSFVVVGLAMAGVLRAATASVAANARRDQVEGTLEILATQPVSVTALGFGWSAWPLLEALFGGLVTLVLAIPLGFHVSPDWLSVVCVMVLSAAVFLSLGFLGGAAVLAFQQGHQLTGIVVVGMTLVSGSLFPPTVLPDWLQSLTDVSPLYYSLNAMRDAVVGGRSPTAIGSDLLVLAGVAAVSLPLALGVLRLAFAYARRRGSLARF